MTRTNILQLQPSIRPVPAQVTSKYFTFERAAKTLHRMLPCTLVSVPAKITSIGLEVQHLLQSMSTTVSKAKSDVAIPYTTDLTVASPQSYHP